LNWDAQFLAETERRHDEVNSCIDVLLSFGGFMYVGTALPWAQFHQPNTTGITYPRLIGLGILVLLFRRIPALLVTYKNMPSVVKNWKEAILWATLAQSALEQCTISSIPVYCSTRTILAKKHCWMLCV
jgi:NhaP-type Na+/H+ or K+/H+ antiporter